MKKTIITSIATIAMCCPAIADTVTPNIAVGTNPASCTESVLKTTSGTSNLEANWTANTLNLKWYDDENGNEITPTNPAANTCTYDSGITVPSNTISKTGYTFAGWAVKAANTAWCSGMNCINTQSSVLSTGAKGTRSCSSHIYSPNYYYSESCSDSFLSDLNVGEWKVTFEEGAVKGIGICSSSTGPWYYTSSNPNVNSAGGNCFCKVTEFNGQELPAGSTGYFMVSQAGNANDCNKGCAANCNMRFGDESMRVRWLGFTTQDVDDCSTINNRLACGTSFMKNNISYNRVGACVWYDSSCKNPYVNDCSTITDEAVCELSYTGSINSCFWYGGTCEEDVDD